LAISATLVHDVAAEVGLKVAERSRGIGLEADINRRPEPLQFARHRHDSLVSSPREHRCCEGLLG
jgi:hypothetical protein